MKIDKQTKIIALLIAIIPPNLGWVNSLLWN